VIPDEPSPTQPACPHIDAGDSRCAHRFTLRRMDQAFGVCLCGWRTCPIYQMLAREQHDRETQRYDIQITVGHSDYLAGRLEPTPPLRPTGS
jgi:hypothetical protein